MDIQAWTRSVELVRELQAIGFQYQRRLTELRQVLVYNVPIGSPARRPDPYGRMQDPRNVPLTDLSVNDIFASSEEDCVAIILGNHHLLEDLALPTLQRMIMELRHCARISAFNNPAPR